jgi:hypothetical protein
MPFLFLPFFLFLGSSTEKHLNLSHMQIFLPLCEGIRNKTPNRKGLNVVLLLVLRLLGSAIV